MTGFVNALAILIFMAQLPELNPSNPGVTWITYALVAACQPLPPVSSCWSWSWSWGRAILWRVSRCLRWWPS